MFNIVALQALSLAQAAAPLPFVAPDLQAVPDTRLSYYEGTWTCEGSSTSASGETQTEKGQLHVERKVKGIYVYLWASEPTASDAEGRKVISLAGYDPLARRLVRVGVSSGGGFAHLTSDGWQDDGTFAWEGTVTPQGGEKVWVRVTDTKVDENSFDSAFEVKTDDGWQSVGSGTCSRATR
jgi:hypothetical protein